MCRTRLMNQMLVSHYTKEVPMLGPARPGPPVSVVWRLVAHVAPSITLAIWVSAMKVACSNQQARRAL